MESVNVYQFILLLLFTEVNSRWILEVGVHRYVNEKSYSVGNLNNRVCCDSDGIIDGKCSKECDNYFLFCLQDINETDENSCPYGKYETDVIGGDDLEFEIGKNLSAEVPNPLVFHGEEWPEEDKLRFITRVYDDDSDPSDITPNDDANDDLVSTIKDTFTVSTSDHFTPIYELFGLFNKIQVDLRVYCAENYFGSQCSVFCEPMDGKRGHYTCDSQGNIVCLEGYLGKETNCTTLFNPQPTVSSVSFNTPSLTNISFPLPTLTESNTAETQSTQLNIAVIAGIAVGVVLLIVGVVGVVVSVITILLASRKKRKHSISNCNAVTGSSATITNQMENPNYSPSSMGSHVNLIYSTEDDVTTIRNVENPLYGKTNNKQEISDDGYEKIGNAVLLNSIKEEIDGNNYLLDVSTKVNDEDIYYSNVKGEQEPTENSSKQVEGAYYSEPPNDDQGLYEYTETRGVPFVPPERDSQYEHYEFDSSYRRPN